MKKKILATILCICMIVPCFASLAFAVKGDVTPWGIESINVAPKGKTYHSSMWNADSTSRVLNNGQYYNSWQFWRPGDEARGAGYEGVDNTRQWTGMSFNYYQTINSLTIYAAKYGTYNGSYCGKCAKEYNGTDGVTIEYKKNAEGEFVLDSNGNKQENYRTCKTCGTKAIKVSNERNNIKYTVEILVQGQWYVAGHGYNNDSVYITDKNNEVVGGDVAALTINFDKVFAQYDKNGDVVVDANGNPILTDYATTKNVRVVCTEYGSYALRGTTNEISFTYSGSDVTSVNYAGKSYTVTKNEEASVPTYDGVYSYENKDGTRTDYTIRFTANPSLGGSEFKVVMVEKEEPYYNKDGSFVYDDAGKIVTQMVKYDRYFFEYDSSDRVKITQKLASTHDWWLIPCVHEIELWGHQAVNTPRFDVPEGAEVVTDAALGGMASATTSMMGQYPLRGNDRLSTTQWIANDYENQSYWVDFDGNDEYSIKEITLNFGYMSEDYAGSEYVYDLYLKQNGEWKLYKSGETVTTSGEATLKTYEINDKLSGFKVTFTSSKKDGQNISPSITDTSAPTSDGKQCVFLSGYLDNYRAASIAQGNIAPYGEAYCSSSFDFGNISDIAFIIDGKTSDVDAYSWYAKTFEKGTYCGVKLKESEDVTKVVLYFNDQITQGKPEEHVMLFDIQALVNGEYKTVASATSYDPVTKKAIVSIELDEAVRTNDIRVVYQTNGMVFPYLKEIEVFAGEKLYSAFDGYVLDTSVRTLHGRRPTTDFAELSFVKRAKYMEIIAPLEFLVFATRYNLD